ncbi:hypothetical protein SAMN04488029_2026 [Reichenbachiella faecimaris]|uniref:Uncharacterized protein n=2 Tax=Reichenbachiella faecimaris TaxID=692418 RepID=A0A1W2GDY4_REIFA|nr:hypothetical protein SAMN04488029_2026 [Reichenbachiella faecimaris]
MMKMWNVFWVLVVLTSCGDPNEDCCNELKKVTLGEPFSITQGETIDVDSSIIEITFTQLINDSLCPEDVECVTQGTLTIKIDINGTEKTLSIGDNQIPQVDYKNYVIELQQLVYPTKQSQKDNGNSTYAVQMLITRT